MSPRALTLATLLLAGCAVAVNDDVHPGAAPNGSKPGADAGTTLGAPGDDGGAGAGDPSDGGGLPADSGQATTCASPYVGALAAWDMSGEPGNQATTAPKSSAPGVTAGGLARANPLTPVAGTSSMNSSNWATSSKPDSTRYYTLTVTPPAGCALDATSLSIDTKSSATGPASLAVATSADGFGTGVAFAANTQGKVTLTATGQTKTLEVRVYGWDASSAAGTWRVQGVLTVTGALK